MNDSLVKVSDYGLKGSNYYWENKEGFNISAVELQELGIEGNFAYINESVIPALLAADAVLKKHGFYLFIKDAYRSPAQYKLIKKKRYEINGKEDVDKTLNTTDMPHSNGYTLDVALYDCITDKEVAIRDKNDWPDGIFIDFYKGRTDREGHRYHELQTLLISTMCAQGFRLGSKQEIWHFEYIAD